MNKLILEEIQRMNLLSKYDNSKTLSEQQSKAEQDFAKAKQDYAKANPFIPRQMINQPQTATDPWTKFPCVTGSKNAVKTTLTDGNIAYTINKVVYYANGRKMLADKTMANFTCNDAEFKSGGTKQPVAKPVATPPELKDIKAFQDWLDNNHGDDKEGQGKGWATRFPEGKLKQGAGYGKFGPRTQKAWATYKDQYLKDGTTPAAKTPETTTPAKVETPPTNDQPLNLQLSPQQSALNSLKYAQQ